MDAKEFKELFSDVAIVNGFASAHGGWFRESTESIVVLDLQKSNFGNYFELNIKIFVQGLFGNRYTRTKKLVKRSTGDIFLRPPDLYKVALDLDVVKSRDERKAALEVLFREFLAPTTTDALSRAGIASLGARGLVHLLPAVRRELDTPLDA
jgi:hypothetical protein